MANRAFFAPLPLLIDTDDPTTSRTPLLTRISHDGSSHPDRVTAAEPLGEGILVPCVKKAIVGGEQ